MASIQVFLVTRIVLHDFPLRSVGKVCFYVIRRLVNLSHSKAHLDNEGLLPVTHMSSFLLYSWKPIAAAYWDQKFLKSQIQLTGEAHASLCVDGRAAYVHNLQTGLIAM